MVASQASEGFGVLSRLSVHVLARMVIDPTMLTRGDASYRCYPKVSSRNATRREDVGNVFQGDDACDYVGCCVGVKRENTGEREADALRHKLTAGVQSAQPAQGLQLFKFTAILLLPVNQQK